MEVLVHADIRYIEDYYEVLPMNYFSAHAVCFPLYLPRYIPMTPKPAYRGNTIK